MKTRIFAAPVYLLCLFTMGAAAQATATKAVDKPKTDLETFQEKFGTVIVKGYSELPEIAGAGGTFQITIREFRNPADSSKVKGLSVAIDSKERYSSKAHSFVEYGEIDSLIKGINYIAKIEKSVTTMQMFEAEYKTKGDFSVTLFNRADGTLSVSLEVGRISTKSIFIPVTSLGSVVAQLEQAKTMLDAL